MNRFSKKLMITLIAGLSTQIAVAAANVATVNGKAIPQSYADALMVEQKAKGTPDSDQLRGAVREELVRREILLQAASKSGINKKPEVATQMELAKQAVVIRAYLQDFVANNEVTDADVRSAYDELKGRIGSTEYKVNHILVEDETEARALIAKLQAGEKFDELAKAHSKDPGSKDKGGELGWSNPGMYVPAFSEAMVKLGKGQMTTEPVKSNFGYHIIKVEDKRLQQPPPYEEVKDQMRSVVMRERYVELASKIRSDAEVDVQDPALKALIEGNPAAQGGEGEATDQ